MKFNFFKQSIFISKKTGLLILILALGLGLRIWKWPDYLEIDHEKTRDLIDSMAIYVNKDITLLGPTTEIDGVFHGPLYYYLVGFFYFLTGGDPRAGSIISFGFNIFGILTLFYIGKNLFNKKVGLIAAFLYAISFESISYAYWLSNPGPAIPLIFIMFYFFYKFLTSETKKSRFYLPLTLFCLGLTIQFQVLHVIFIIPLLLLYLLSKKPIPSFKTLTVSIFAFFLSISSFIFYELKYNFLMSKNIINHVILPFFSNEGGSGASGFEFFPRILNLSTMVFFPIYYWVGAALFLIILATMIYQIIKTGNFLWTFLLVWIFSTFPVFFIPSRIGSGYSAFIGISGALILVFSFLLDWILKKSKLAALLVIGIILAANIYAVNNFLTHPQFRLFDYFQALFLKTNLALIDYSYNDSEGKQFKTDTVTSPLFISKTWDYLFDWRGRTRYGRVPQREGKPEIGYLILEPYAPEMFKEIAIKKADLEGELVETKRFGEVTIQKRILKH